MKYKFKLDDIGYYLLVVSLFIYHLISKSKLAPGFIQHCFIILFKLLFILVLCYITCLFIIPLIITTMKKALKILKLIYFIVVNSKPILDELEQDLEEFKKLIVKVRNNSK